MDAKTKQQRKHTGRAGTPGDRAERVIQALFQEGLATMVGVVDRLQRGTVTLEHELPALSSALEAARLASTQFVESLAEVYSQRCTTADELFDALILIGESIDRYGNTLYGIDALPLGPEATIALPASLSISLTDSFFYKITPDETIELERLIRIIDPLIQYLNYLIRVWSTHPGSAEPLVRARHFFEALQTYRGHLVGRLIHGPRHPVPIREVIRNIRPILHGILGSFQHVMRPAGLRTVGALLAIWLRELRPAIGLGGSQSGAAAVALLHTIVAITLTLIISIWLGRVIGNTRVGEKTIDEHLADYFSVLFATLSAPCQVPLEQFYVNWAARLRLEALANPPKALVKFYLVAEIEDLDELIENGCGKPTVFWQLLRDERSARLAELAD